MRIVTIVSSRVQGSPGLHWNEYLCFSKGSLRRYRIFTGTYELLDISTHYLNVETGKYETPAKIGEKSVVDIVGDWVVGGNITSQTPGEEYEFDTLLDKDLLNWFISNGWSDDYGKIAALII